MYKILDEAFHFYIRQKEAQNELCNLNVRDAGIVDLFEENRNKSCNVIDSVNLWIENCLLYQDNAAEIMEPSFEVNSKLFVEMYIYGIASQSLSLISLSKKFGEQVLFTGIKVNPNERFPLK